MRAITLALFSLSSVTLYRMLFGAELASTRFAPLLRLAQWMCLPFLACAILLPYCMFLPLMWGVVAFGLALMTLGLATLMLRSRNQVAMWFAASFAVTFVSSLGEVVAAALGMRELSGVVNSVTAALASSLLAALAIAEQMRLETEKRMEGAGEARTCLRGDAGGAVHARHGWPLPERQPGAVQDARHTRHRCRPHRLEAVLRGALLDRTAPAGARAERSRDADYQP